MLPPPPPPRYKVFVLSTYRGHTKGFIVIAWPALCQCLTGCALNYKKIQNIKNEKGIFVFSKTKTMQLQEP